jgi:hypothetical protein
MRKVIFEHKSDESDQETKQIMQVKSISKKI